MCAYVCGYVEAKGLTLGVGNQTLKYSVCMRSVCGQCVCEEHLWTVCMQVCTGVPAETAGGFWSPLLSPRLVSLDRVSN